MKKTCCVVYGTGKAYDRYIDSICGNFTVTAVVDKSFDELDISRLKLQEKKFSFPCMKREEAVKAFAKSGMPFIVTSGRFFMEIRDELMSMGINQLNILPASQAERFSFERNTGILFEKKRCADIGGPSSIFSFIYDAAQTVDIVNFSKKQTWSSLSNEYSYKGRILGNVIENDATDLKDIPSGSYDAVLSSNNLEHIANPLKAVKEWIRILKKGGLLFILVPDKEYTFDHRRNVVLFEHLVDDYKNDVTEDDLTHLEEILQLHDLTMDKPAGTFEQFRERSLKNFENRCLHQHVFDCGVLNRIAEYFNLTVLTSDTVYLCNWVLIASKKY